MLYFKLFCFLATCSALAAAISVPRDHGYDTDEYDYDRSSSYEAAEKDESSPSLSSSSGGSASIQSDDKPVYHHHKPATSHVNFYQKHKHGEHKFTYHQKHGKHGSVHGHSYPAHHWGGFPPYHHH